MVNQGTSASSQFAFTSKTAGDFQACFTVSGIAFSETGLACAKYNMDRLVYAAALISIRTPCRCKNCFTNENQARMEDWTGSH